MNPRISIDHPLYAEYVFRKVSQLRSLIRSLREAAPTRASIAERIAMFRERIGFFEHMYGMSFDAFSARVAADEAFVRGLRAAHPYWEEDSGVWTLCQTELEKWERWLKDFHAGDKETRRQGEGESRSRLPSDL